MQTVIAEEAGAGEQAQQRAIAGSGLGERQESPCIPLVSAHLCNERLDALEPPLLADEGVKRDLDLAAVQVSRKIEQVRFEKLLGRIEGGTNAQARHSGMLAAVLDRHSNRVDAVPGPLVITQGQIGGWIAKFAPPRIAFPDNPLDCEVAAEEMGCPADVACSERGPNSPRGHALAVDVHGGNALGRDCMPGRERSKELHIACPSLAESEVVTCDDSCCAELLDKEAADEIFGTGRAQLLVKLEYEHCIGPGVSEERFALVEAGQPERGHLGFEIFHGVRVEGGDDD